MAEVAAVAAVVEVVEVAEVTTVADSEAGSRFIPGDTRDGSPYG